MSTGVGVPVDSVTGQPVKLGDVDTNELARMLEELEAAKSYIREQEARIYREIAKRGTGNFRTDDFELTVRPYVSVSRRLP